LLDISLIAKEKPQHQFLLGAVDECTPSSFKILQQLEVYKSKDNTDAPIGGEGASFFLLSNTKENTLAEISAFTFWKTNDNNEVLERVQHFLTAHNIKATNHDIFISNKNFTNANEQLYATLQHEFFTVLEVETFKKYCGEYPTAVSFGITMAVALLSSKQKKRAIVINNYRAYWSIYIITT